jgi:hypothetical protein
LQIWNGCKDEAFYHGLEQWRKLLLESKKIFIYAGNDSHGNFNLYRQIKLPFWSLIEKDDNIFGKARTIVNIDGLLTFGSILSALQKGNCYLTDGPALNFYATDDQNKIVNIGARTETSICTLHVSILSTPEFGPIHKVRIFTGLLSQKKEIRYKEIIHQDKYVLQKEFSIPIKEDSYFRIEAETQKYMNKYHLFSNPIWANPLNSVVRH